MTDFCQELMRSRSAYFLDGWLKFTEETWGLKAERVMYSPAGKERPALEGVLYLAKDGKVRQPPLNAYLPLQFYPTPTEKNCQLYTQWMSVAQLLAQDIKGRGFVGNISFPPGFTDGRCFQWLGIDITCRYTFVTRLPYNGGGLDSSVRNKIKKAKKEGYAVERTEDYEEIVYCLKKTADYKGYDVTWSPKLMEKCAAMLGGSLLTHVAKAPTGTPVSAQVKVVIPDGLCVCIGAGTDRQHMNSGVAQLIYHEAINDVLASGTRYFDFCGANIEAVARAKSAWGFPLVPSISLVDSSASRLIKRSLARRLPAVQRLYGKARKKLRGGL